MFGLLKRGARRVAAKLGYEVVRPEWLHQRAFAHHLARLFARFGIDCVLDVGAHRGEFRDFVRGAVGFAGLVVSFEPLRDTARALEERARSDPRWIVCTHAFGSRGGDRDIHVTRADVLSSFLTPDASVVTEFADRNVVARDERVPVRRLDEILPGLRAQHAPRGIYLKLDTQGFDLEVVAGAGDELAAIAALQTELSVRPIYAGMPDHLDALRTLRERGFAVSGMYPVTSDPGPRTIELDCVLVNEAHAARLATSRA
jgi:FkbM family methyltransferase